MIYTKRPICMDLMNENLQLKVVSTNKRLHGVVNSDRLSVTGTIQRSSVVLLI